MDAVKLPGNAKTSGFTALWRGLSDGECRVVEDVDSGEQTPHELRAVKAFGAKWSSRIATAVLNEKQLETMRVASFAPPIRALVAARASAVDPFLFRTIKDRDCVNESQDRYADAVFRDYLSEDETQIRESNAVEKWTARWHRMLARSGNSAHHSAKGFSHASTPSNSTAAVQVVSLGAGFEMRCCAPEYGGHAAWVS